VAHPDRPCPATSADDADSPAVPAVLLSTVTPPTFWRIRSGRGTDLVLRPEAALRLSSLLMVRDAVLAGAGAAMLPKLLVADDVAAGRLALWGPPAEPPVEIWALQSSRRLIGTKVRAFVDLIEQAFPDRAFAAPTAPDNAGGGQLPESRRV
jgi:DNA-binding transcriptional LysR family regulator